VLVNILPDRPLKVAGIEAPKFNHDKRLSVLIHNLTLPSEWRVIRAELATESIGRMWPLEIPLDSLKAVEWAAARPSCRQAP
jgi:hypothetical protein